jgi:hypothetical protein
MAEQVGAMAKDVIAGIEKKLKPERSYIADYIGLMERAQSFL